MRITTGNVCKYLSLCKPLPPCNDGFGKKSFGAGNKEAKIYLRPAPNPACKQVSIGYQLPDDENIELVLVDITGKAIYRRRLQANGGEVNLDLRDFAAGLYHVKLRGDKSGTLIEKLLIIR